MCAYRGYLQRSINNLSLSDAYAGEGVLNRINALTRPLWAVSAAQNRAF